MANDSPFPGEVPFDLPVPGGDPAIAIETSQKTHPVHAREIENELEYEHGVVSIITTEGRSIFIRTPSEEDITGLLMGEPDLIQIVERVGDEVHDTGGPPPIPVRKAYLTEYLPGPLR